MQPELGILADDLTGATDTGLQFAKSGWRTHVSLNWSVSSACDVLVLDTDSRARPMPEARKRVFVATQKLRAAGVERFYKKIDSTVRGNLGAEIEATLEALDAPLALICPAFPQLGRTVRDGVILVRGLPLEQTEFAQDPLWPATTASIEDILRRQTSLEIASLALIEVRRGPAHLRNRLKELVGEGVRLVIADAESAIDLRCLIEAVRQSHDPILPVGSAGLAEWLVSSLSRPARVPGEVSLSRDPILVIAGTMNRLGLVQVARLVESGARLIRVSPEAALNEPEKVARTTAEEVRQQDRDGGCIVLALADPTANPPDLGLIARERGLGLAQATERLVNVLGQVTSLATDAVTPAVLILTGGDTARAVCTALGANGLDVYREAAPGIPISLLDGGRWDGLPVVTKAGGFGGPDTLVQVVKLLQEMRR